MCCLCLDSHSSRIRCASWVSYFVGGIKLLLFVPPVKFYRTEHADWLDAQATSVCCDHVVCLQADSVTSALFGFPVFGTDISAVICIT